MKTSTVLLMTGAAVAAVYLLGRSGKTVLLGAKTTPEADDAPIAHLVEETLHRHAGQDGSIVQAFEEALAQEKAEAP